MENRALDSLTKLTPLEAEMLMSAVKFYLEDRMVKYRNTNSDMYLNDVVDLVHLKKRLELYLSNLPS